MPSYLVVHRLMRQLATGELSRRGFVAQLAALGFTTTAITSFMRASAAAQSDDSETPAAESGSIEGEGVRGGTLIVALNSDFASLDLMFGSATINRDGMGHVYEYLFTMGEGNVYIPDLAEDMQVLEDGTTFTIALRQGAAPPNAFPTKPGVASSARVSCSIRGEPANWLHSSRAGLRPFTRARTCSTPVSSPSTRDRLTKAISRP